MQCLLEALLPPSLVRSSNSYRGPRLGLMMLINVWIRPRWLLCFSKPRRENRFAIKSLQRKSVPIWKSNLRLNSSQEIKYGVKLASKCRSVLPLLFEEVMYIPGLEALRVQVDSANSCGGWCAESVVRTGAQALVNVDEHVRSSIVCVTAWEALTDGVVERDLKQLTAEAAIARLVQLRSFWHRGH